MRALPGSLIKTLPSISLALRNTLFTIVVPGAGGVYVPWLILTHDGHAPTPMAYYALTVIILGVGLYLRCVWMFATVGRGTPGLWDAPRQLVALGPYRWVRSPIYLSALLIVSGGAWLFLSRNPRFAPNSASSTRATPNQYRAGSRADHVSTAHSSISDTTPRARTSSMQA